MTKREKQKTGLLLMGALANSFVEILGLAAVLPVIGLVIEPELIQINEYLSRFFDPATAIGISSDREFLMLLSIMLVAIFLFKALYGLLINLFQTRFSLGIGLRLSGLMWRYHFSQSLEPIRSQQSGKVLAEISSWPNSLANVFIVKGMRLISDLLLIALIALGLLAYEPIVLMSVMV